MPTSFTTTEVNMQFTTFCGMCLGVFSIYYNSLQSLKTFFKEASNKTLKAKKRH